MAVGLVVPEQLLPVKGVELSAVAAGIRNSDGADVVLLRFSKHSSIAAVFTQNQYCAAPVQLAKQHLQSMSAQCLLINAGNANAGTGVEGLLDATETCRLVSEQLNIPEQSVIPFSTGVIGQRLPVNKIKQVLPAAVAQLDSDTWLGAAKGIMTTDTLPKAISRQVQTEHGQVTITGIAKGSGMICPDMATMLGFIATDAKIDQGVLEALHKRLVTCSFNRISVDGDTSTNDACVLLATGQGAEIDSASNDWSVFEKALLDVYQFLAQAIIRDGEGATKFVAVSVIGGNSGTSCEVIARTVAHSPLVKTALYASDANWGRILAAIGRAGVTLDINKVALSINDVQIIKNGQPHVGYTEEAGTAAMQHDELNFVIDLGLGSAEYILWTSDLSHEYVTINAEYRT